MALTPIQLQELQDISIVLAEEFPSNVDDIWDTAIRFQLADIGPLGVGGLPVFEAAVADLKITQEQLQTVQGRNAGAASGYLEATLDVTPAPGGTPFPAGLVGDVIYLDTAPNVYLATSVLSLTPAGPNSVILSEVAAAVARTVAPAAGGIEVNNLLTGAGFERVLTTADLGGGAVPGGVNTNIQYNNAGAFGGDGRFLWDGAIFSVLSPALTGSIELDWRTEFNPRLTFAKGGGAGEIVHPGQLNVFTNATNTFRLYGGSTTLAENLTLSHDQIRATISTSNGGGELRIIADGGTEDVRFQFGTGLAMEEKTVAHASLADFGQFWVRDDVPNVPMFTDDAGTDFVLNAAGGGGGGAAGSITYAFDASVGGDPGAGEFRMSTANPANISALTFSDTDVDALDIQNILGTLTVGCHILMRNTADNSQFRVYVVTSITDNVGWWQFNVDQAEGSGNSTIGAAGTEIEFEFFTSGWVQPGVDLGISGQKEFAFWNPTNDYWEGSATLISMNQNSPPTGGRFRLGSSAGYSTTTPQIMRVLGASDVVMDFVYSVDPNNGFLQGYRRVAGEMSFGARIASVDTDLLTFDLSSRVRIQAAATFMIGEKAAATADLATYGQLWVNSADDSLNYQTEAGVNFDLTAGGGGVPNGTVDGQMLYWDQSGTVAYLVSADMVWSEANETLTIGNSGEVIIDGAAGGGSGGQIIINAPAASGVTSAAFFLAGVGSGDRFILGAESTDDSDTFGISWNLAAADLNETVTFEWLTYPGVPLIFRSGDSSIHIEDSTVIVQDGSMFGLEKAAAALDRTGYGQLWVLDEGFSQSLMYTNDNGNDFELAALNLTDMNTANIVIAGTTFVECLTSQPDINRNYMVTAVFEITSPAADNAQIQMVIDTNATFKGIISWAGGGGNGEAAFDSAIGEVITNNVTILTDGTASPDGTYVTITGCLRMGATSVTHSVRMRKDTDTGADGRFEATAALQLLVLQVS